MRRAAGAAAWLQVVHGENVSNRVRGHLRDPNRYRNLFHGLIQGLQRPQPGTVTLDFLVTAPLWVVCDGLDGVAKWGGNGAGGAQHAIATGATDSCR